MTLWRLILREIGHRKLSFLLGLLSVSVAVGCLVGALTLLQADQHRTELILNQKREEVVKAGADLEDAMRVITKGLGFNIIILPADQDLDEMNLEGSLSKSMPEDYVHRLANSKIVTVNHLLPTVIKKLVWPEKNLPIILYGTRGEVPILHADPKKPILDAVPPGQIVLGYQLSRKLNLSTNDSVQLLGRKFNILKSHEQRGTVDDNTVWINLSDAQELLRMQNLIHAIQALECQCAGERLAQIREEITRILPGTQVVERGPPALARAEARTKAKETAELALAQEKEGRAQLRHQREQFAGVLVPLVLVGAAVWVGFLSFGNVRQRTPEIGILRAIGFRSGQILSIFLGKSLVMGLAGSVLGYLGGALTGLALSDGLAAMSSSALVFDPGVLVLAVVVAPLLSLLASWVPALLAARKDPALVLQSE
jgi:putative ABC transport system permease protein